MTRSTDQNTRGMQLPITYINDGIPDNMSDVTTVCGTTYMEELPVRFGFVNNASRVAFLNKESTLCDKKQSLVNGTDRVRSKTPDSRRTADYTSKFKTNTNSCPVLRSFGTSLENGQNKRASEEHQERNPRGNSTLNSRKPNLQNGVTMSRVVSEFPKTPTSRSRYIPGELSIDELFEKTVIECGERFEEFFDAEVRVSQDGHAISGTPYQDFDDGYLPTQVLENVKRAKYTKLTPIQKYAMPIIYQGYDLMACSPTGSGKTAAFLLPLISLLLETRTSEVKQTAKCPLCIILAPTRELASQIKQEARKFSCNTPCNSVLLYGGTSVDFQRNLLNQCTWILVATVGRLLQFVEMGLVSLKNVRYLIFDEADRMLEMGFSQAIDSIMRNSDIQQEKLQTLMFSATFPAVVQALAAKHLRKNYIKVTVDKIGMANRCIRQELIAAVREKKMNRLLEVLKIDVNSYRLKDRGIYEQKTLVFVNTKKFADVLASVLTQSGLNTLSIHGDRMQHQREQALYLFREGAIPVLIATSVAERGLDIRGVDHVINFDLPTEREEYVHRIGRTGRVGNPGRATSFYDRSTDLMSAKWLVDVLCEVGQKPPEFLLQDAGLNTINTSALQCLTELTSNQFSLSDNENATEDDEWY